MHFFIDHTLLPTQVEADAYGPDATNPTTQYNVSSKFLLTALETKAFACETGMLLVQQSDLDASLVNVIIEPTGNSSLPFGKIKYFVYRGILKKSLINGLNIAAKDTLINTELITRIYAAREAEAITYTAEILAFDNNTLAGTVKIDTLFLKGINQFKAIHVQEGEWFGNFTNTHKIAFEVIVESDKINLDLAFFRKGEININVGALTGYDKRIKQEEILCFIDPAAFWGLYFYDGVRVSIYSGNNKSTPKKKGEELYTLLIAQYFTRNRVYLDIRSEHAYSYNMYQNYADASNNNIKQGNTSTTPIAKKYATNGWPILFIDGGLSTTKNTNNVIINLRIDDNLKPTLYVEDLLIIDNPDDSYFIDEKKLLQNPTDTEWTNEVTFKYPNTGNNTVKENVAYHLKLTYYRQINNPNSPNTVLPKEEINDGIFGLDMPNLNDGDLIFQHTENERNIFLYGELDAEPVNLNPSPGNLDNVLPPSNTFSCVAKTGAYFNSEAVTFYAKMDKPKKQSTQSMFGSPVQNFGLNMAGKFATLSFLSNEIMIVPTTIEENTTTGTQKVDLLTVSASKSFAKQRENLMMLGITPMEVQRLKTTPGLSNKHPKYIKFDWQNPFYTDLNGIVYKKAKLVVHGLDENGVKKIVLPAEKVEVYAKEETSWYSELYTQVKNHLTEEIIIENGIKYENLPLTGINYNNYQYIGSSQPRGNEMDLLFSTGGNISFLKKSIQNIAYSDKKLFALMQLLFSGTSVGELDLVARDFIYQFSINTSVNFEYENLDLNRVVAKRTRYINYIISFAKDLENKLNYQSGNILTMSTIVYYNNDKQLHPTFSTDYDKVHGLQILMNDTEYTDIFLEPNTYSYSSATKIWSAIIVVKIIDHFGLDTEDIYKFKDVEIKGLPVGDGFAAWYALQHNKGYVPFLTRVVTRCRISGKLNF